MQGDIEYLRQSPFIDCDNAEIQEFAHAIAAGADGDETDRIVALYHAVRDRIIYDPYVDLTDPASYRASSVLTLGRGFCIGKAALLAACARAIGIPARVGYADVRNHMTSPRLYELTKSDIFLWHSYADLKVDGSWVKATPAFDAELCRRVGLAPLEFDGRSDSLFQAYDRAGQRRMEYLSDRGTFADVPFETLLHDFRTTYPALVAAGAAHACGDFQQEAVAPDA
ncbi:MAG: transglutaminase-like domain-containing protein [Rhodoplanes sp.]